LNSRKRVLQTLHKLKPDSPPLDGWFLKGVVDSLKANFGAADEEGVCRELGIDFRSTCMDPLPSFSREFRYLEKMGISIQIADYKLRRYSETE
jgi:hypothetical protein